ncbi:hypothetical protein Q7P37_002071 [Cladosporium fusiforme]
MSEAKLIVQEAYDNLAEWYQDWVHEQHSPRERYTLRVLQNATSSTTPPTILELGCGPGVPITHLLLRQGARVLANDISPKQITLAKTRCPAATYLPGDMSALSLPRNSLDGAVSFFTLFHLPRAEQESMLAKIHSWLKPGALLACNFATVDAEEIHGEMMGRGIFWSGYGVERNRAMVLGVGFEVVGEEVLESEADGDVEFMWVAARKPWTD